MARTKKTQNSDNNSDSTPTTPATTTAAGTPLQAAIDAVHAAIAGATTEAEQEEVRAAIQTALKPVRTVSHKYGKQATVAVTRNGAIRRITVETTGMANAYWLSAHIVELLKDEGDTDGMLGRIEARIRQVAAVSQMPKESRPTTPEHIVAMAAAGEGQVD